MLDTFLTATVAALYRAADAAHDIARRLEDVAEALDWTRAIEKMRNEEIFVEAGEEFVTVEDAEQAAARQLERLMGVYGVGRGDHTVTVVPDAPEIGGFVTVGTTWYEALGATKDDDSYGGR